MPSPARRFPASPWSCIGPLARSASGVGGSRKTLAVLLLIPPSVGGVAHVCRVHDVSAQEMAVFSPPGRAGTGARSGDETLHPSHLYAPRVPASGDGFFPSHLCAEFRGGVRAAG